MLVATLLAPIIFPATPGLSELAEHLALQVGTPTVGWAWQVFTHPFIDAGVLGTLVSGFFFYWIVGSVELAFGRKKVMRLIAACVAVSAAVAIAVGFLQPTLYFGSGGVVFGCIAAQLWALRHHRELQLFGTLKMRPLHMILIFLGIDFLFFLEHRDMVRFAAEIACGITGMLFVHYSGRRRAKKPHLSVVKPKSNEDKHWLN